MSRRARLLLPVELLTIIGSLVRHPDLPAFALASKCLNTIATPHLYARVELVDFLSAKACFRTLSLSPAVVYSGRDLPKLVRVVIVRQSAFGQPVAHEWLGEQLLRSMDRMVNLEVLRCGDYALVSLLQILGVLALKSFPKLQIVELAVDSPLDNAADDSSSDLQPVLPSLRTLKLFLSERLPPRSMVFLQSIVGACAVQLEWLVLSTPGTHPMPAQILANPDVFPALTSLEVEWDVLHSLPIAALHRIRALSVRSFFDPYAHPVLPNGAFPALEELTCSCLHVGAFFGDEVDTPRPIHTITLDRASYERNGGSFLEVLPEWKELRGAFADFARSTVPVKNLRFCVARLNIRAMAQGLSGLKGLESLLIVLQSHPTRVSAYPLFYDTRLYLTLRLRRTNCKLSVGRSSPTCPACTRCYSRTHLTSTTTRARASGSRAMSRCSGRS